ncbi:hypothetical protein L579_4450 [Pantoea sp. AS-PWVM4]|nr:hypothetical protein L579_4450 [Pantoea sp. AS-PWVM4]
MCGVECAGAAEALIRNGAIHRAPLKLRDKSRRYGFECIKQAD